MTVKEIVEKYLKDSGCDGLCSKELDCGCGFADLFCFQCEGASDSLRCEAAYRGPCICGDHDFDMYPTKDAAEEAQAEIDAEEADDA